MIFLWLNISATVVSAVAFSSFRGCLFARSFVQILSTTMSNINDKATVSLFVNGEQAESAMDRLRKKAEDLDKQLQTAMAAGDKKTANSLQRELDRVTKELNKTESAAKGTGIVLNNLANSSIHGLRNALKYLEREFKSTRPGTEAWEALAERIKEVKARLLELNGELEVSKSRWAQFKEWALSAWPALDLLNQWSGNIFDVMRGAVDAFASMDQEMANVRKFTGMTADQVADLNEEFKKIDTRTSREDLNKLAQEAGRLGKTSKEDVLGFVRAADQINVALDDLGEGATLTLSKLTGVFGDEARYGTEQSLLKVGSVINELSQNCSASAPYLAQFASRMGGVGAQAKMTIPQIMAFGAVLDSNGQAVEASSTALSQVIVRMMQEPAKYAKVAGLDVKKFSDMLKNDVNGALIMFLETLQKAGGMDTLSPMFKDMGENGSRAIAALSTLATHIDQVKQQLLVATAAFAEGTSVTKEFNVQNTTVQALLDKAKKRFQDLRVELGEKLYPLMTHVISSTSALARAISVTVNFFIEYKTTIFTVAAAIATYTAALKIHTLWLDRVAVKTMLNDKAAKIWAATQKMLTGVLATGRVAVAAMTNAFRYLTNGLEVNYAMQQRWRKAMAGMSFASWTGAILAIASAFVLLYQRMKKLEEENRVVESIQKEAIKRVGEERVAIDLLVEAAHDETLSLEERKKAIDKLNAIVPGYNGLLDETTGKYKENKDALDQYLKSLTRKYELEGAKEKLAEIGKKKAEATINLNEATASFESNKKFYEAGGGNSYTTSYGNVGNTGLDAYAASKRRLANAKAEMDAITVMEERILKAYGQDLKKEALASVEKVVETSGEGDNPFGYNAGSENSNDKPDRFAEEKAWREHEEAEVRIHYAKGETSYSEHMERMAEIERDYYQKLLDRADVVNEERYQIEASFLEAERKFKSAGNKKSLDEETRDYQDLLDRLRANHQARLDQEGLSAQDRQHEQEYYDEVMELAELQHLRNIRDIYKEGSDEWLEAQRRFQEKEIAAQERHLKNMERQEQEYANIKKKVFGLNQDEKDAEFARQFAALTAVYNQELAAVGDNEAEKLRIKEAYMAAELALRKEYNQSGAEDTKSAYETAVGKSVEWLQGDGGKALTGAVSTLTSGMSSIFSGLSSMIQAELEIQTAKIEKRYDREIELAQGNSYKVAKLEKQKQKELAKMKNEANKKMFAMQVIQAVAQTAQNALGAYGSTVVIPVVGKILAPIAAAAALAAGMIQVATIKKQQQAAEAQGYSKGGFTKPGAVDEPAGIVHAGEWVASQKLLANPVARPMIEALDRAQRTNTIGSLKPEDVSRSIRANDSLARIAEDDNQGALMVAAFARNSQAVGALVKRLNEPFVTVNTVTGDHGIKQAQDEYSRLMDNVTPKSKRKK